MTTAAFLSFRFGPADGVSVEARKWAWAFDQLGIAVRWVADDVLPGLGIDAPVPPSVRDVVDAVDGCDVVVVENLLSLPLNPGALAVVAEALRGRAAIVRHHDLPWQRERFATWTASPPSDPAWAHVTINELSRVQLADRGIEATRMYNRFRVPGPSRYSSSARGLVLHPVRAIARKNVPVAVRLAERLRGTYWLLGPAEDGYGDELERVLASARCEVRRGLDDGVSVDDAYAMCDVVAFPSSWEGFGNPTIESALARRPLVVGDYPVARELRSRFGFRWLSVDDDIDVEGVGHNEAVALEHFCIDQLPGELAAVLERVL